ncbi:TonB-dependent receptor domain-containing protein [Rheinheimera mangrovi]|uniref:TonB-dependent receptor domain-containing protein n=1 Tax=Rheinheimera mangrovi TaxID=2498451 RepID=UPI000F8CAD95|nr:TonB-dependent receptor [Rheinheimera mangrovi]
MFKKTLLATVVAGLPAFVFADSSDDPLEHISVYATRQAQPVHQILSSVTVLDREQIEQAQVSDLPALLRQVAGVQISRSGGKGQTNTIFLRGGSAGHTLVLIDGVRTGSATLGYASLAELSLQQIEQIEVIKGPKAALYGSDAIAGVIAITTRKADNTSVQLKTGRYQSHEADIATSQQYGDVTVRANLGWSDSEGFDVRPGTQADKDGFDQRYGKLGAEYNTAYGVWSVDHNVLRSRGQYDYDPTWGPGSDQVETKTSQSRLGWALDGDKSQQKLSISRNQTEDLNWGEDSPASLFETERQELDYQYSRQLTQSLTALTGVNWYQEDVSGSDLGYDVDSRINKAIFAGFSYQSGAWLADVTGRYDKQSQYGHSNTYEVGLGYQLTNELLLRASRSSAFKAPSFNDLYYPLSGNKDLAPETATSDELGLRYRAGDVQIESSIYQQNVSNLIQWAPAADGNWVPQNVGEAKIKGAELSVSHSWQQLHQQVAYSYTDAKDESTDAPLIKRSKHTVHWQGAYQWQDWRVFVTSDYQSDFHTGDFSTPQLGGYTLWGAGVSYELSRELQISAKADNLTNKDYLYVPGYATAGAEWSLRLNWTPDF